MPYINKADRKFYAPLVKAINEGSILSSGALNYLITMLINDYVNKNGRILSYSDLNDVMGALEGAKSEFYRRVVVPYEERKRTENGDVYE